MRKGIAWISRVVATVILSVFLHGLAYSEMAVMEWEVFHNSPGRGSYDGALFVDFDGFDNVYVTGRTESDYTETDTVTIKYDPEGNELWLRSYDDGTGGRDMPLDMVSDLMGNVYVAGTSAVIKYDPEGALLWAVPCEGYCSALEPDGNGGVYVTGDEYSDGSSFDYRTMRLDAQGNPLWVVTYDGQAHGNDRAVALAVDAFGDVVVTGTSLTKGEDTDYATIKYDADGNQLWEARYTGPEVTEDEAFELVVDELGNVYVFGESQAGGSGSDYLTLKYDADGQQLWARRYNGPNNARERPRDLLLDHEGNLYVTGSSKEPDKEYDCVTIKYDADGTELQVMRYDGPDQSVDIANSLSLDPAGNIYITGKSYGESTGDDFLAVKYAPDGQELDVLRYDDRHDEALAGGVDQQGNLCMTGRSGLDFATVKYGPEGNQLWVRGYNGPSNAYDIPTSMALDGLGHVYVTGRSDGPSATVKYDSGGNEIWAELHEAGGTDMDVDPSGFVYVTGYRSTEESGNDYATSKYDPAGTLIWTKQYNGTDNDDDEPVAVAVDALGNVVVTGSSEDMNDGSDYLTLKYDAEGDLLWADRYNGGAGGKDRAVSMAVAPGGEIFVTGTSRGLDTGYDYVTLKYDPDGNRVWENRYLGTQEQPASFTDEPVDLVLDDAGNVYVTGSSYMEFQWSSGRDYLTIKYDPGGNEMWAARYRGVAVQCPDDPSALAVDASGNVYVTGTSYYWGCVGTDYATVKYGPDGAQLWAVRHHHPPAGDLRCFYSDNRAADLSLDSSGNLYVTGTVNGSGTWVFDPFGSGCVYAEALATLKYDTEGSLVWKTVYKDRYGAYPYEANGIAVDSSDNIYIIGTSFHYPMNFDYVTLKYTQQAGNPPWGPASAIAVTSGGSDVDPPSVVPIRLLVLLLAPALFILLWKAKRRKQKAAC